MRKIWTKSFCNKSLSPDSSRNKTHVKSEMEKNGNIMGGFRSMLPIVYEEHHEQQQPSASVSEKKSDGAKSLDDFQLLKVIGKGCMGKVFLSLGPLKSSFCRFFWLVKRQLIEFMR